jgi:glycosyltransferase involved in cell wall biosynthesis
MTVHEEELRLRFRSEDSGKLLYFIGVDWFFYSHFLDRAIAAKEQGYDVVVLTGLTRDDDPLAEHGIKLIGIPFERRSMNPLGLMRNLVNVIRILKQEKPDIIHQVALKPILVGSIATRVVGIKRVINAVVGLGFAFSSETDSAKTARRFVSMLFDLVLDKKHAKTVFENADDRDYFLQQGWVTEQGAVLIRGAGVDIERFSPGSVRLPTQATSETSVDTTDEATIGAEAALTSGARGTIPPAALSAPAPTVMLLSRMLWDKGIGEFVGAARMLTRQHGKQYAQFVLVGDPDDDNRGSISREQLLAWQQEGIVRWWGYKPDVANVLTKATISCLPSYREGLPKSLLESLAMGLPCIATDVPGCREAVKDGINGLLVPPRDTAALANAIYLLLGDPELRQQFGQASRKMAVEEFSREIVNKQTLDLYASLMRDTAN